MAKQISYYSRDFIAIRGEIIDFIKRNYPDTITNFDDASVGAALIDAVAAVGDNLSYNLDRVVNENLIDNMQQRYSLLEWGKTMGVKIPPKAAAISVAEFTVDIPAAIDNTFDINYAPLVLQGVQLNANGQTFETLNAIDFSSEFSTTGQPNRKIIPIYNQGRIAFYRVVKTELVIAGRTKVESFIIDSTNSNPFQKIALPDSDVLSVQRVIALDGTNYTTIPTLEQWTNPDNIWYEVDSLAESEVFVGQPSSSTDNDAIIAGDWQKIVKKFVVSYDINGFASLEFGNGTDELPDESQYQTGYRYLFEQLQEKVAKQSLGLIPKIGTTLFVEYRVGGGQKSNVAANTMRITNNAEILVNGVDPNKNANVRNSFSATNIIPALGGRGELTNEELRYLIKNNFVSQNRCVTLKDYNSKVMQMGGQFGRPYSYSVYNDNGTVVISIINIDSDGKLTNESTTTLKENIASYLNKFTEQKLLIEDGRIINLAFEFDILTDSLNNRNTISQRIIDTTFNYINSISRMGETIYLANLAEQINNIGGVLNVIAMRVYNRTNEEGQYSTNKISQSLVNTTTKEINISSTMALNANPNDIFEIKFKNIDIKTRFTA